jgi:hypothetical protein
VTIYKQGNGPSPELTTPAPWPWTLSFLNCEDKFLLFKHTVYGILLWQPKLRNIYCASISRHCAWEWGHKWTKVSHVCPQAWTWQSRDIWDHSPCSYPRPMLRFPPAFCHSSRIYWALPISHIGTRHPKINKTWFLISWSSKLTV